MDVPRFYETIAQRLRVDKPQATRAAEAVLMALHLRMPEDQAERLQRLLPTELQNLWRHGGEELKRQRGSMSDFSRGQFLVYVADRLGLDHAGEAEQVVRAVFGALREQLPESDRLVRQAVPEDIRDLWTDIAPATRGAM